MKMRTLSQTLLLVGLALLFAAGSAMGAKKDEKNEYPNATRTEPKKDMSPSNQRDLTKALDLVNDNKPDEALPLVQRVLDDPKASKYARALALQAQGQIAYEKDDYNGAIAHFREAYTADALPNNSQFQVLYQVAQLQIMQEKYPDALASLDEWFKVTGGVQKADAYALQGNSYYRMDKYQQAIDAMKKALALSDKPNESWMQILMACYFELDQYGEAAKVAEQQLAKDQNNKKLIQQLSSIYIKGKQEQKALDLMASAKQRGLITTEDDYKQLAQLYNYLDKSKEAAAVLTDGLTKAAIKPSYDIYKLLGDAYALSNDDANAIEAYGKASPFAKDGNADYLRGNMLLNSDRAKEARDALTQAISKGGLKQQGEAYVLLGNAEYDLGNTQAAIAAFEKARGYPSTQKMADSWLKNIKAHGTAGTAPKPKK